MSTRTRSLRTLAVACTAAGLLLMPVHAAHARAPSAQDEQPKYTMKPRTARVFGKVREELQAERYGEAESLLAGLHLNKLNPFERAQALRLYGYVAYGKEDNDAAIDYLGKALAEAALPPVDQADTLFQVAQIQAAEKRWRDVISTLDRWFQTVERPNSVGYFLQALAWFQQGDLDAALLPATKAVQIAKKPQQTWLQLLLAIHLTKKDYAAAAPVLDQMLALYPNSGKDYWLQLSALYGVTDDQARSLGVLELAHRKGLLTEDQDLRRLLQLMLARGIPYRAAQIFAEEMRANRIRQDADALEMQGASWILAREVSRAEEPLTRAAELAAKGDLYVRVGQLHMLQEEWSDAADALRKALAKGGLTNPGSVQLLLGIACYNEHKLQEARSWFVSAQQSGATREQAETWLQHIDRELAVDRSGAGWGG